MFTADGVTRKAVRKGESVRGYLQGNVAPCIAAHGEWVVNVRRLKKAADTGWGVWV